MFPIFDELEVVIRPGRPLTHNVERALLHMLNCGDLPKDGMRKRLRFHEGTI
jgi:hypothetical protein